MTASESDRTADLPSPPESHSNPNNDTSTPAHFNGPVATSFPQAADGLANDSSSGFVSPQDVAQDNPNSLPHIPGYVVEAEIARGGMGVVYRARNLRLNRPAAIKMLIGGKYHDPLARVRFMIEAEAVAQLDHPHIVHVHEFGTHDNLPFFALEFIGGGTLSEKLARAGKPAPRAAAELLLKLAEAIAAAHAKGIIHRDLKPSNVLLTEAGEPKVVDFGLAKMGQSDMTATGAVMGTPSYMSPEQAAGKVREVGVLTDVYSLGAILFELLTSEPPFKGESSLETIQQVLSLEPERPRAVDLTIPRDLETICLKCLEKKAKARYSTATELAEDLRAFLEGLPIQARPVGHLERAVKWVKRNPVVTGAVAAVALALVSGTTVSYLKFREAELQKEIAEDKRTAAVLATAEAQREREAERWERYRSNMIAAGSAMQLNNMSAARDALEATPEEHRKWEWLHFYNRLDTAQYSVFLSQPTSHIPRVFTNRNKAVIHTADDAGDQAETLHVWDLTERKEVSTILEGCRFLERIQISNDGRYVSYLPQDHSIRLWDLSVNRFSKVLSAPEKAPPLSETFHEFSPDSRRLAAGSRDGTVRLWDIETGKQLVALRGHEGIVMEVHFSPDGRRLISAGGQDRTARIWDLTTGETVATLTGHEQAVTAARFNAQGDRVLTLEYFPSNSLRLWDAAGKLIAVLRGHTSEVRPFAFNLDGSRIATGSFDQTVRLWNGRTGEPVATLKGHAGWVHNLAFSSDGSRIVSASQDHSLRLWDAANGQLLGILHGHTCEVLDAVFSQDGSSITSFSIDGNIRWWDVREAERNGELRGHTSFVYGVAFHPDGERVASASWDGSVRVWNATTGRQLFVLNHPEGTIVSSVSFQPEGKLLASLGRDDAVHIWDVDKGREVHRLEAPTKKWLDSRVAFSPRGDRLACGGMDNAIHVWDVKTWAKVAVLRGHRDFVRDVVFARDGAWLASAGDITDKTVRIWDVATGEPVRVLEGHTRGVYSLAVSPDGSWLASGSKDGTVRLWDTTNWKEVAVLKHGVNVYGLSFAPDGQRLACACANNAIHLWDMTTHKPVAELLGHRAYIHQVAFSPDGTRLVSASGDNTVRVWDSLSVQERAKRSTK